MVIKGVAASLPERRVANEELVEMVRQHSTDIFVGDLERTLKVILHLLKRTGLVERRWCDRHESPLDHIAVAVREALSHTYLRREHIDLLIYVGVGRGFLEPANSHMVANALGLRNAQCFDILDACMSWLRALEMVDGLFRGGRYRNALVVNAEFHSLSGGLHMPQGLKLHTADEIPYSFPAWTIGDAASATLLVDKEPSNFRFNFIADTSLAPLCTIPIPGFEEFCHPDAAIGKRGVMTFTSFGQDLHRQGAPHIIEVLRRGLRAGVPPDIIFVHASSQREWAGYGRTAGVADRLYHLYPHTGNLVSASVPTAMAEAARNGKLTRGMNVGAWVGSAGMSFGYAGFRY